MRERQALASKIATVRALESELNDAVDYAELADMEEDAGALEEAVTEAARRGCQTIGGLDMLVAQAAAQFSWWTGAAAPETAMRQAALARLGETPTV